MPNRKNYNCIVAGDCYTTDSTGKWLLYKMSNARYASRSASDYNRRKPRGSWLAPTNYSMVELKKREPNGTVHKYSKIAPGNPAYEKHWEGFLHGAAGIDTIQTSAVINGPGSLPFPTGLANRSLISARNKLKDSLPVFNLGIAYAERNQVARMAADLLERVARALIAVRRRNYRAACRELGIVFSEPASWCRTLSSRWLWYQYGWKPLLQDIYSAVEALKNLDTDRWKVTVKGKASSRHLYRGTYGAAGTISHCDYELRADFGCMTRIDAVPDDLCMLMLKQFGLTNPASVAWEATRLSFLVDWAYPLGDFINQMDALVGWKILGCSTSSLSRITTTAKGRSSVTASDTWSANWSAERVEVQLTRTASGSVPFPMLPSIKNPVSFTHLANALALLHTAVYGGGPNFTTTGLYG